MIKTFPTLVAEAKPNIQELSAQKLALWLETSQNDAGQPFVLVDVREREEMAEGMIKNAIGIPRGLLDMQIQQVTMDPNACIVLYCAGGNRSALAALQLQAMGYQNVYSLAGGYKNWPQ